MRADMTDFQSGGQRTSGNGRMKHCIWSTAAHKNERIGDVMLWPSLTPTGMEPMDIDSNIDNSHR